MTEFDPTQGPTVSVPNGEAWDALRDRLQIDYRSQVYFVAIELDGDGLATIDGFVASEAFSRTLEELVVSQPSVKGVANNVIVTAALVPAQTINVDDWVAYGRSDADDTVSRYPSVVPVGRPQIGALFELTVDLTLEPDGTVEAQAMKVIDLPSDWRELSIETRILSQELDFKSGEDLGTITIVRDDVSRAHTFVGRVTAGAIARGSVAVTIIFEHNGRFSGSCKASFDLVGQSTSSKPADVPAPSAPRAASSSFLVTPAAQAADLTVHVIADHEAGNSSWVFSCPRASELADVRGVAVLGRGSKEYLGDLFKAAQFYDPATHQRRLQGIGERIWEVAPAEFRELYRQLRQRLGRAFSIQIVTDDPFVPWEMMYPQNIADADHLFMSHPISRWVHNRAPKASSFASGDIVSFVPKYGTSTLDAAVEEGEFIVTALGGKAMPGRYAEFLGFLSKATPQPIQIVHFAGHGRNAGAGERGIEMEDGTVTLEDLTSSVIVGKDHKSLFVLNACEAAGADFNLGVVESWPEQLIKLQFGAVIAPLWAVRDVHASEVIKDTLKCFVHDGLSLSEAMRRARAKHRGASSTPYAYLCYGDVMAKARR